MSLISFAQNQEDIMLWRALKHISNGFYIDVGAADPVVQSVTKLFYDHGWHGINLEPQPIYFGMLSTDRPCDINLRLAAGREARSYTFHRIDGTGLSTLNPEIASRHKTSGWKVAEETIEVLPLAEVCRRHRPQGVIHFLKIDVEGSEGDVLAGADFHSYRPWIVVVEATLPMSQEESHADWEPILTGQGYSCVWFDGLNRFYLADEMKDDLGQHFEVQPNVFDDYFMTPSTLILRAERADEEAARVREELARTEEEMAHVREQAARAEEGAERIREQAARAQEEAARIREQAAETLRDAQVISRQAITTGEQSARQADAASRRAAEAMQQTQRMAQTLHEMARRTNAALAEQAELASDAQRAAREADERVAAMLKSTSWRMTAPLRMVRRMMPTKQLARKLFHRGARLVLRLPGAHFAVRLVRKVAPGPVEWFARRYRAYEYTANTYPHAPPQATVTPTTELSPDEARLHRHLAAVNVGSTKSV